MLLLKFTFCFFFFFCAFGYPLDTCALRAKIMIASNFYREGGWERNWGTSKILLPLRLSQGLPKCLLIYGHPDLSFAERNSLEMEVMRNYLKSCLTRVTPTSTFTASTLAWRRKTPTEDVEEKRSQKNNITEAGLGEGKGGRAACLHPLLLAAEVESPEVFFTPDYALAYQQILGYSEKHPLWSKDVGS